MTEDMEQPSREAPKAIIMSVYIGAITSFILLISFCFCIGNISPTASYTTGVPLIQIFYDLTGSVVGTCFLSLLIVVIVLVCANAQHFCVCPRSSVVVFQPLRKVEPKRQIPAHAILLACGVQVTLNSIYFGTLTDLTVISSLMRISLSYAMLMLARTISWFMEEAKVPYNLGRYGIWMNTVGPVFLVFTSITFNFPTISPEDSGTMNYTSATIGVIAFVSVVTWVMTGRKAFTGSHMGGEIAVQDARLQRLPGDGRLDDKVALESEA